MKKNTFRNLVVSATLLVGTFYLARTYLNKKKIVKDDDFSTRNYYPIGKIKAKEENDFSTRTYYPIGEIKLKKEKQLAIKAM